MEGLTAHHAEVYDKEDLNKPKGLEYEIKFEVPHTFDPGIYLRQLHIGMDFFEEVCESPSQQNVLCFKGIGRTHAFLTQRFGPPYDDMNLTLKVKSSPIILSNDILKRKETEKKVSLAEAFRYAEKMQLKYIGNFRKYKQDLLLVDETTNDAYMITVALCSTDRQQLNQLEIEYFGRMSKEPATEQEIIDGLVEIVQKIRNCNINFKLTPTKMEKWELVTR